MTAPVLKKIYWKLQTLTSYGESEWTPAGFFYIPTPQTGESIVSQITANRKFLLSAISTENGYTFTPVSVEEEKLNFEFSSSGVQIRIMRQEGSADSAGNTSDTLTIGYIVMVYILAPDEGAGEDEIVKQNRNIIPDIQKAWMSDIYCGGLAENTRVTDFIDGVDTAGQGRFYSALVRFEVTTRINSLDPYSLG